MNCFLKYIEKYYFRWDTTLRLSYFSVEHVKLLTVLCNLSA